MSFIGSPSIAIWIVVGNDKLANDLKRSERKPPLNHAGIGFAAPDRPVLIVLAQPQPLAALSRGEAAIA